MVSFCAKMKALKCSLRTLSYIKKRVGEVNEMLKSAQILALESSSQSSFQGERDIHNKLLFLREIEEPFLKQISRINWLKDGDHNSRFFHRVVATRNSYNSIRALTLLNGTVCTDAEEMQRAVVGFFHSILAPDILPWLPTPLQWFLDLQYFRCNFQLQNQMTSLPSNEEILCNTPYQN